MNNFRYRVDHLTRIIISNILINDSLTIFFCLFFLKARIIIAETKNISQQFSFVHLFLKNSNK